jgi:hypothetical protein
MKTNKYYYFRNILNLIVAIAFIAGCDSPAKKSFQQFQRQVKESVDPMKLQDWAISNIKQFQNSHQIPNSELPSNIKQIGIPGNVQGFINTWGGINTNVVILTWGGGFGSWGLIVGAQDYVGPQEDANDYIVPWISGVYFYMGKH